MDRRVDAIILEVRMDKYRNSWSDLGMYEKIRLG